jgi:GTP 3',8-cyclase
MTIISEPGPARLSRHFGARGGQLRISLTPRCQIGCWFCHNEGETPPRLTHEDPGVQPRPPVLGAREILTTIEAMVTAGVRRVFITGGEPLVSALAKPVLRGLPEAGDAYSTTLITNGLRLEHDLPWITETRLDRIKVSLHYFSDASFASIAGGSAGGIAKIKRAIEAAVEAYGPGRIEINTLLQSENEHEIGEIIAYALGLGISMQIIELVGTEHNRDPGRERVTAASVTGYLRRIATDERVDATGTGQSKRVFTVGRSAIELIDASLGRYHVGQCTSCPVKDECVEGFWALRLEAAGSIRPCLLREDLRLDVRPHLHDPHALAAAVTRHIDAFTEGTL